MVCSIPGIRAAKKKRLACLIALCCASQLNFASAEEVMTVTSAAPTDAGKVIVNTKDAAQPLSASDGGGLLATLPGFSQIRNGGSNGDPVFRGMFGSRLNILADGGNLQGGCGSRMDSPTSYISPKNFDLVEIISGPQTVLWGPMASAGTVLFERAAEHFTAPGIKGSLSTLFGANGRSDQQLSMAVGNQSGWMRVDANRSVADDFKDGDGQRVPGMWRKWNGGVTLGWTPSADDLVELSLGGGDGEARYAGRGMDGAKFLRKSASLKVEKYNLTEHLSKLSWRSYYNSTDHIMDNFSLREAPMMKMASEVGSIVYGTRLSAEWQKDATQITAGVDAQQNQHRKKQPVGWEADAEYRQAGVFAEWQQQVTENGKTVTGLRIDNIRATDLRQGREDIREANLPGAFMRYEHRFPDMPVMAWSGIGYTERFPDYWELFSGKAGGDSFHQLKNEKTLQWDSGVQYQGDDVSLWLSGWINKVNDYVLFDYSTPVSRSSNIDASTFGGETGAGWRFATHWKAEASLTYTRGENLSQHRALPQIPPLDTKVALTYSASNWDTTLTLRGVASQGRVAKDQGNVIGRDLGRSPGFGVLSWKVNYQLSDNLSLGGGVDNILNKNYAQHLNTAGNKQFGFASSQRVPEPGRSWWFNAEYKF
ncbi:TonB-dependent copper receptor [Izhakiella australiensis]|nr:TonB-dependent copper receptor [Izhakiella australiensis]